jgi:ABC-type polysaccharide/polyol phosphate export permease
MGAYLCGIWKCRYFWLMLVKNDLRQRYRRSLLGMGWTMILPVAMTAIICFVFRSIFSQGEGLAYYAAHVLAGLACWSFILTSTVQGCQCLFIGEAYIRQYPAPMAIYPLRTALAAAFQFLIAISIVVGFCWTINGFGNLPVLPVLLPSFVLLFIVTWSLAVLAGFANVYLQDTQHLCDVGFQILFYMTPIIYPEAILKDQNLDWIADYNPVRALIDVVRKPILNGELPEQSTWVIALVTTTFLAGLATYTLARLQKRVIFAL